MSEALARDLPSNHDTSAPEKNTPIEAPATYAVLWNREAAAEALNERRIDLRLSMIELDETANQAAGTSAKYLSPGQTKCLGVELLFRGLRAHSACALCSRSIRRPQRRCSNRAGRAGPIRSAWKISARNAAGGPSTAHCAISLRNRRR